MDVATLGLAVDSSQVDKGTISLNKLAGAARQAETATKGTATGARASSAAAAAVASSADNAAAALTREAGAARQASGAMSVHARAVNDNAKRMGGSMSGLAAQFQDIGVTAAMGMNPAIIALQQGTQIAGQMEMAMQSGASAVGVLGTAFKSLFSPLTFITIALTALAAVGLQLVDWPALAASALNGLAAMLQTIAPYATLAAAALALLYAPQIIMGIVSVIAMLGRLAVAAITAAAAMAAANPAAAFVLGVTAAVAAANIFRDELTQIFGVDIVGAAKTGVNLVIGSFVAAFEDVKFVWNNFPAIVGSAAVGAANAVIGGMNAMISKATELLNGFIAKVNGMLSSLPFGIGEGVAIPGIGDLTIGSIQDSFASQVSSAVAARNSAVQGALSRDYLGDFGGAISRGASAASAKLKELAKDLVTVDEKAKKKGGKTAGEKFSDIVRDADAKIAALRAEQAGFGQTAEAAARLRYEQELLNKATQAGLSLDPQQIALLKAKAAEMASVEAATARAKDMQQAWNDAGSAMGGVLKGLIDGTTSWGDALQQLIPIVLKLLNQMNIAQGGKGLFGGGFFQSLLGGLFGVQFAKGGVFAGGNVVPFARGGVVDRPTVFPFAKGVGLMGEAGPEAIMPLRRMPNGRLGVEGGGGGNVVTIEGSSIVIQGNADGRTVEELKRYMDERDRKLMREVPKMVDGRLHTAQTRKVRA